MMIQIELEELEAQKIAAALHERYLGQTTEEQRRNLRLANKIVKQLCEHRNKDDSKTGRPREEV